MQTTLIGSIVLTLLITLSASQAAEPTLKVKPGAWEMTMNLANEANFIPPDALAKMPADQRAKMEAMMRARGGQSQARVHRTCVTQQDLDQNTILKDESEGGCTTKLVSRTSTRLVYQQICASPQPSTTNVTVDAPTPETVSIIMDRMLAGAAGSGKMEIKGRWLGASCAGLKQ